jgi:hypothetical protein
MVARLSPKLSTMPSFSMEDGLSATVNRDGVAGGDELPHYAGADEARPANDNDIHAAETAPVPPQQAHWGAPLQRCR